MEETNTNVHVEVNELHHCDIIPNQGKKCKEVKNVACTTEKITENPEYVVMHRTTAVGSVTNEEIIIPKQESALNFRHNITVLSSDIGGNTTEMDISSQESAMDIASQESLHAQDLNSEEPTCYNHRDSVSFRENAVLAREDIVQKREEAVQKREEAVLAKEEDVRKREKAVLNSEAKVTNLKEEVANHERILVQMEMDMQKQQELLNIQTKLIKDRELILQKREIAVQNRELQADGCKLILPDNKNNGNGCLPAKRPKKI